MKAPNKIKMKNPDSITLKENLYKKLKDIWGYDSLKPEQEEAIISIMNNNSTLAALPTGFGKSICFQLPAVLKSGISLIITPLISLMEDQVVSFNEKDDLEKMKEKGIAAVFINSSLNNEEKKEIYRNIYDNQYKLIYITPERFIGDKFIDFIHKFEISQIVIDEVHCIKTYGTSDFRKSYLEIGKSIKTLKNIQENITVSAFSGTVSVNTLKIIENVLGFNFEKKIIGKAYKDNIAIITKFYETKKMALRKAKEICISFKKLDGKILIFGGTIKETRDLSRSLKDLGLDASYYYAGLASSTKTNILKNFKSGKIKYLCATSAFGMGIDIPDIRAVIHASIPTDMENFVQEIGRAGRDGKESVSILLGCKKDVVVSRSFLFGRASYYEDKIQLDNFIDFIKNEDKCKISIIADYFGNDCGNGYKCGICSSCLN